MITFKQFLLENQNYPLFHGTTLRSLDDIIRQNKIKAGKYSDAHHTHSQLSGENTISLTRSKNFATYWSQRISWYNSDYNDGTVIAVIELNRQKIRNNKKIIPYNHFPEYGTRRKDSDDWKWAGGRDKSTPEFKELNYNQFEERIVGELNNVSKYITKVYLSSVAIEKIKKNNPGLYNILIDKDWLEVKNFK